MRGFQITDPDVLSKMDKITKLSAAMDRVRTGLKDAPSYTLATELQRLNKQRDALMRTIPRPYVIVDNTRYREAA